MRLYKSMLWLQDIALLLSTLNAVLCVPDQPPSPTAPSPAKVLREKPGNCHKGDLVCEKDKLGYEAISSLHGQMDDDHNGDIDLEESEEFLREELQYSKSHSSNDRSRIFHKNDTHITVDDLWQIWKLSEVHNWTVDNVVYWLVHDVELPQYAETFKMNAVDGSTLPRLAVNNLNFVSNILGIRNLVHKQKLALKATDVVLFGPPKWRHNYYKDAALITAIVVAAGGCWFAYRQNRLVQANMQKTIKDMDSLASAEVALRNLQEKLQNEENEKWNLAKHKELLEAKVEEELMSARLEAQQLKLSQEQTETQLSKMRQAYHELEQTKEALRLAEKELEVRSSMGVNPSVELQRWLQITYELELKAHVEKKNVVEQQLTQAKESCERMRRKKQALFGSLRMAHSGTIDETDSYILLARQAIEEVRHDLSERQYRWQQIENLCMFPVISNPGLKNLIYSTGHTDLYKFSHGGKLLAPSDIADLDLELEDVPPTYVSALAASNSSGNFRRNPGESFRSKASSGDELYGPHRQPVDQQNGTEKRPHFQLQNRDEEETTSNGSSELDSIPESRRTTPLTLTSPSTATHSDLHQRVIKRSLADAPDAYCSTGSMESAVLQSVTDQGIVEASSLIRTGTSESLTICEPQSLVSFSKRELSTSSPLLNRKDANNDCQASSELNKVTSSCTLYPSNSHLLRKGEEDQKTNSSKELVVDSIQSGSTHIDQLKKKRKHIFSMFRQKPKNA